MGSPFTGGKGWSDDKIRRFIQDWTDGMESAVLREKYGARIPSSRVNQLRRRGFVIPRRVGEKA